MIGNLNLTMNYKELLNVLWLDYEKHTPSAHKIHNLLETRGEEVLNDHIAFRTINHPLINVDATSKLFLECGYEEKGTYHFEEKKLLAKHFEHPDSNAPKVFISELLLEEFSPGLQHEIQQCINKMPLGLISSGHFILSGRTWGTISHKTYQQLLSESEYAAWWYVYGFGANHFTVDVNSLKSIESLDELNALLKVHGFSMNNSGGEIKGGKDVLLAQSSILADKRPVEFSEGLFSIPGCYYEFAYRYEQSPGRLFQGFVAGSADKIFESTNALSN